MRYLLGILALTFCLLGCGPNRKVQYGDVVVTAVETVPAKQLSVVSTDSHPGKTLKK